MYSFNSRIRYSELDETGRLRLESLLDYFQDCSTFHSEDIGLGVDYLKERHLGDVLLADRGTQVSKTWGNGFGRNRAV